MYKKIILIVMVLVFFIANHNTIVFAGQMVEDEMGFEYAKLFDLRIQKEEDSLSFSGYMNKNYFNVQGKIYNIFDLDGYADNYYLVEKSREYHENSAFILNLEFVKNAKKETLELLNQDKEGQDFVRIALAYKDKIYYCEQQVPVLSLIIDNSIAINYKDTEYTEEVIRTIKDNSSWYMNLNNSDSVKLDSLNTKTNSQPPANVNFSSAIRNVDKSMINNVGIDKFTEIKNVCATIENDNGSIAGVYYTESVNWPVGTEFIKTSVIYCGITANTPSLTPNYTSQSALEVNLTVFQNYNYQPSTNTISFELSDPTYRIYNVDLNLHCARKTSDTYDYIYSQQNFLNSSVINKGDIALSFLSQFDKYKIVSTAANIFSLFSKNNEVRKFSSFLWPSNYSEHYSSFNNGKIGDTMLRGVRVNTDGYLLKKEGDSVQTRVLIADRDYENDSKNDIIERAILFGFSFELRRGGTFGFLFGGDTFLTVEKSMYKSYER